MDPLVFGLIMGGVALVAVAVILYFLVFKKKIQDGVDKGREKRAAKEAVRAKNTSMAGDMFAEREREAAKGERSLSDDEIGHIMKVATGGHTAAPEVEKPKSKKEIEKEKKEAQKEAKKDEEVERILKMNTGGGNMGVSSAPSASEEPKKKEGDDKESAFNPMGQFGSGMK